MKALVVGATGKIGQAVCMVLARSGFDIGIHYSIAEKRAWELAGRVEEVGRQADVMQANLAKADECEALEERAYKELGRIDAFVHCASAFPEMPLGQVMIDDWNELMAINLRAPFFLSQSIGLKMKEEGIAGRIVHFSDIAATCPYGDYLPYCMSKAAIDAMVKGLARELAPRVNVNAIAPYLVRTGGKLGEKDKKLLAKVPLKRATSAEEVANLVHMLIGKDSTITGQVITVDAGRTLSW